MSSKYNINGLNNTSMCRRESSSSCEGLTVLTRFNVTHQDREVYSSYNSFKIKSYRSMALFSCLHRLEFLTKMWTTLNTQNWLGDTLYYSSLLLLSLGVTCNGFKYVSSLWRTGKRDKWYVLEQYSTACFILWCLWNTFWHWLILPPKTVGDAGIYASLKAACLLSMFWHLIQLIVTAVLFNNILLYQSFREKM